MIKIKNVNKSFENLKLFENLSLDIPLNQLTFIVGASGCGKTTLLNIIGGLEETSPDTTISIELKDKIIDLKQLHYQNLIDFVFQDFNLLEDLNGLQNIAVGNGLKKQNFNKKDTVKLLEDFGIEKEIYLDKVKNMSMGERQRIAILRSVSRDSKILLVDEPTANLDEENAKKVLDLLKQISKTKTIIVVTHDIESAQKYSDNILELSDGKANYIRCSFKNDIKAKESSKEFLFTPKTKFINNHLVKLKIAITLSFIEIRKKWFSFLMIFLSLFLIIFTGVSILQISTVSINISSNITSLESNRIIMGDGLSDIQLEDIKKERGVASTSKDFDYILKIKNYKSDYYKEINRKNTNLIKRNDFFENQITHSKGFEGQFLQRENDIIISQELQEKLKITNPIGKNIVVSYGKPYRQAIHFNEPRESRRRPLIYGKNIELRIVGINKSVDYLGNSFNYLDEKLVTNLFLDKDDSFPKDPKLIWINKAKDVITKDFDISILNGTEKITKTFAVENPNDNYTRIYLSTKFVQTNPNFLDIDFITKKDQFLVYKRHEQYVKIVGVFESDKEEVRLSQEDFNKFLVFNDLHNYIYFYNQNDQNNFHQKYLNLLITSISNPIDLIKSEGFNKMKIDHQGVYISIIPIVILIPLTIAFIFMISKILANSKKREIAILKVLGAGLNNIIFFHTFNLIATYIIVFIAVIALYYPLFILIGTMWTTFWILSPNPNILFLWMFYIWISISFVCVVIQYFTWFLTIKKPYKKLIKW